MNLNIGRNKTDRSYELIIKLKFERREHMIQLGILSHLQWERSSWKVFMPKETSDRSAN